ncbi:hypothetical protein P691DRAFT_673028 [Macrolepiota fuliginosa MF-IS2]|uniref:Uncharacterized protein n=1 Tax=Macrolepiota fuliginosa MF-IS2 TaxID=1400762 RepID=A0A9P5XBA0_9AGAR|nr:hypothetical protein P691DRAFT_673028 [Macrolepiota fuliginosa MF-IS2]
MSLGRALARKGYKTLVEDEVLPIAGNILDNAVFVSFEQELAQSLADFVARANSTAPGAVDHSEVFEDISEDYTSVIAASAPPPPSVLEIVETSLPQVLPAPDPADRSVFEDEMDDDYAGYQPAAHHPQRQSPADQLQQLVQNARYDDAFHLLTELQHLHIDVPLSHTYGTIALEALQRPFNDNYTPEDQSKLFATWLSLIPPAHEFRGPNNLQNIQHTIMHASLTNIPLVMLFCTILTSKGYSGLVGSRELAVVMRFGSSDVVRQHIQDLEAANSAYWKTHQPRKAASKTAYFSGRIRDHAVRYLAYSGKVEDAIALIQGCSSNVQLSTYTYDKLLRTIRDIMNPSYAKYISRIESLRDGVAGPSHQARARALQADAEDAAMAAQLRTAAADAYTGTLPETLRYLKRALRKAEHNPHPFIIADFLERYLATGRTRAPTLLLNLAINSSYHSTSIFVFAEMLYYRRMGQHHLMIQTFINHFYLSGVPREDVLRFYHEAQRLQSPSRDGEREEMAEPTLTRICTFSPSHLPRGKAWPMKIHCNLVWHALVALTPTYPELQNLYTKLRAFFRRGGPTHPTAPHTHALLQPLLPPPSWHQPIDYAAFTPFMRRFMRHSGPPGGERIIRDMMELGVQPSVYHFTELAGYYARMGLVEPVMVLLDSLETSSGLLNRTPEPSTSNTGATVYTIPEPDLVFYISLMRGFIISKSVEGFEAVHKRLLEVRKLLPGKQFKKDQEGILNEVYADFRVLGRVQAYDWRRQRKAGFQAWFKVSRFF